MERQSNPFFFFARDAHALHNALTDKEKTRVHSEKGPKLIGIVSEILV